MNLIQLSEKYSIGIETLKDIIKELQAPGHDPRDDFDPPKFSSNVTDIKNLAVGDMLEGVVRNITDFGAFVDIGLHNDGLVHKSQIADRYVTHPMDLVSLGQQVRVRVVEIDLAREKVSLSMKTGTASGTQQQITGRDGLEARPQAKPIIKPKSVEPTSTGSSISSNIKRY